MSRHSQITEVIGKHNEMKGREPHFYSDTEKHDQGLSFDEIIDRNYNATVSRGLISNRTSLGDFILKLNEEIGEFIYAHKHERGDTGKIEEELADIALVVTAMAKHMQINLKMQMEKKMKINEIRSEGIDLRPVFDVDEIFIELKK